MGFLAAIPAMFAGIGSSVGSALGIGAAADTAATAATVGSMAGAGLTDAAMTGEAAMGSLTAGGAAAVGATAAESAGASSWLPSLTTLAKGASLVGTTSSALGQVSSSNAQAKMLSEQAQLSETQAQMSQESAKEDTLQLSHRERLTIGAQAAQHGAGGVAVNTGSPLDVMAHTAAQYERDMENTAYRGDIGAYADNTTAQMDKWLSQQKQTAGWINAGGTLLTGFGRSLMNKYYPSTFGGGAF